jgi:hypothetical protein
MDATKERQKRRVIGKLPWRCLKNSSTFWLVDVVLFCGKGSSSVEKAAAAAAAALSI